MFSSGFLQRLSRIVCFWQEESMTYLKAGVDTDKAGDFISAIGKDVEKTHRAGSMGGIGGFGGLFDLKKAGFDDAILVAANDGVGTKLRLAQQTGLHHGIGIDLVAMCVNDLLAQQAEPLFFLDYFGCGRLNLSLGREIIRGISAGCQLANCALLGGETAEMPDMYKNDEYDLAGFALGAIERTRWQKLEKPEAGDIILGLDSSGLHSNGFSLVRRILEKNKIPLDRPAPFDSSQSCAQALMTPTRIYTDPLLALFKSHNIRGCAHITGGGFYENIPRILGENQTAELDFSSLGFSSLGLPPLFDWLRQEGRIALKELYSVFNCGIGMVLIVPEKTYIDIKTALQKKGERVTFLGHVTTSSGQSDVTIAGID